MTEAEQSRAVDMRGIRQARGRWPAFAKFLRDPIAHFLLLGGLVFAFYSAIGPSDWLGDGEDRIIVSRQRLLTFIQYRTKAFEPAMAEARLDALSPSELRQLIDDYVREEALYREARSLGLDRQDYIVKRRLVQKVEFLAGSAEADEAPVAEDRLRVHFRENADRFATDSSYTFTHVFIAGDGLSSDALTASSAAQMSQLRKTQADFSDAPRFGDRFPYGVNFVDVAPDQVSGQFGEGFMRQLAQLKAKRGEWQGPLTSEFGAHIVMLVARSSPKAPRFEDVRDKVAADLAQVLAEQETDAAVAAIVSRYPVEMEFNDPRLPPGKGPG